MRNVLKLSLILGLICLISAAILSGVNQITKDRIAAAKIEKLNSALAEVLPGDNEFTKVDPADYISGKNLDTVSDSYVGREGDTVNGMAIMVSPKGYGGPVDVIVGVNVNGVITGVKVINQTETPGLGAEVSRDAFSSQFAGMSDVDRIKVKKDGGDVDAVTGATISSRAVSKGVSQALAAFKLMKSDGAI